MDSGEPEPTHAVEPDEGPASTAPPQPQPVDVCDLGTKWKFTLAYLSLALVGLAGLAAVPLLYLHGATPSAAPAAGCGGPNTRWVERAPVALGTPAGLLAVDVSSRRVTTLLTADMGRLNHPSFSPDGRRLAFLSHSNGVLARIQICDLARRSTEQLPLPVPGTDLPLAWGQDGETLLFLGGDLTGMGTDHKPFLALVESGEVQLLAGDGPWYYNGVFPSPDGRQFAALLQRKGLGGEPEQLVVVDLASTKIERVTGSRDVAQIDALSWSPDGQMIVFSAYRHDEHGDLYLVDLETKQVRTLLATRAGERSPAWSPDGTRIAFVHSPPGQPEATSIWMVDLEKGAYGPLTWGRTDAAPAWSPDGERLVFVRRP